MSYMSNLDLYIRETVIADKRLHTQSRRGEDIAYFNKRHAASILQSAASIATSLRQLGFERAEFSRQFDKCLSGTLALTKATGYSFSALLHSWSEQIHECCVMEGESLERAWDSFCGITQELDW